jgi:CRISPR/Cas system-associated exonuclease Cas4 (RecB family)
MTTPPDLVTGWLEHKLGQYVRMPGISNRASELGGDCLRQLVYSRTRWQDAAEPEAELKVIFQEGDKHELALIQELQRAGYSVIEQQVSLSWPEYTITGHIDARVRTGVSEPLYPVDVKTMSPHIYDSIFKRGPGVYPWEEVREGFTKKPWLRKYSGQLTLYMLMTNTEAGLLLCLNKSTGMVSQVNLELDYEYGEELLRRAEQINEHVDSSTVPERIPYDDSVCPRCAYYHICLPEQVDHDPIQFISNDEVLQLLETRDGARDQHLDYDRADKRVKSWAKAQGVSRLCVGPFVLNCVQQSRGVKVTIRKVLEE